MAVIIGIIVVLVCVFATYVAVGGKFSIILHALPGELTMIFGAAVGAYIISNPGPVLKKTFSAIGKVFKGAQFNAQDYKDILTILFTLTRLMRSKGVLAIESHIEEPDKSELFQKFPRIMADHFALHFICDTLRMMSMNLDDPHQVFDAMEMQLEKHHHEALGPQHALQTMADGLPALGIVAAVLGVIKTMASITEPPEVLGAMIGGALVGTFLGVFLAYGIVGPFATRLKQIIDIDHQYYLIIRDVLVAHLNGNPPQVAVEIGRGNVPTHVQPSFLEMEEALQNSEA